MYALTPALAFAFALAMGSCNALKLAVGGAMDPQHNHHPPANNRSETAGGGGLQAITLRITNKFGTPLQAIVVNAANSPAWGSAQTIYDTATYVLPPQGNGQVTIGHNTNPLGSKIELNNGFETSVTQVYMDVSYVDGFSVPIVCQCGASTTGCSKPLWMRHRCPSPQPGPLCVNTAPINGPAAPFFAPCRDGAYVISNQSGAGTGNFCAGNEIACCIGAACQGRASGG